MDFDTYLYEHDDDAPPDDRDDAEAEAAERLTAMMRTPFASQVRPMYGSSVIVGAVITPIALDFIGYLSERRSMDCALALAVFAPDSREHLIREYVAARAKAETQRHRKVTAADLSWANSSVAQAEAGHD